MDDLVPILILDPMICMKCRQPLEGSLKLNSEESKRDLEIKDLAGNILGYICHWCGTILCKACYDYARNRK